MRKSVQLGLVAAICAAALAGVPAPERAYGARIATTVRIGANRTVARVYRPVVLQGKLQTASGRALGGRTLLLEGRQATGTAWSPVARVKTNAAGRVAVKVRPQKTTYYRYRYRGSSRYRPDSSPAKKIAGHHYVVKFSEPFGGSRVNTATWTPSMQWGSHTRDQLHGVLAGCPRGRRRSARDHGDEAAAHRGRSEPLSIRRRFCAWQRSIQLQVRLHRDSGQDTQGHGTVARRVATAQGPHGNRRDGCHRSPRSTSPGRIT